MEFDENIYEFECCDIDSSPEEGIEKIIKFTKMDSMCLKIKGIDENKQFRYLAKYGPDDILIELIERKNTYIVYDKPGKSFDYNKIFTHIWCLLKEGRLNVLEKMLKNGDIYYNIKLINYDLLDDDVKMFYNCLFNDDCVYETRKIDEYELPELMTPIYIANVGLNRQRLIQAINETSELTAYDLGCIEEYIDLGQVEDIHFLLFLIESGKINDIGFWTVIVSYILAKGQEESLNFILLHNPMNIIEKIDLSEIIIDVFASNKIGTEKTWKWLVKNCKYSEFMNLINNSYGHDLSNVPNERTMDIINMMKENSNNFVSEILASIVFYCLPDPVEYLIEILKDHTIGPIDASNILRKIIWSQNFDVYNYLFKHHLIKFDADNILEMASLTYHTFRNYDFTKLFLPIMYYDDALFNDMVTKYGEKIMWKFNIDDNSDVMKYLIEHRVGFDYRFRGYLYFAQNSAIIFYDFPFFHKKIFNASSSRLEKYMQLTKMIEDMDFHQTDADGHSILHMSVYFDDVELLKYLIEVENMDYYIETNEGLTLIDIAILRMCSEPVVSYLLDRLGLIPKESMWDVEIKQNRINLSDAHMSTIIHNMKYIHSRKVVDLESYCEKNRGFSNLYYFLKDEFDKNIEE